MSFCTPYLANSKEYEIFQSQQLSTTYLGKTDDVQFFYSEFNSKEIEDDARTYLKKLTSYFCGKHVGYTWKEEMIDEFHVNSKRPRREYCTHVIGFQKKVGEGVQAGLLCVLVTKKISPKTDDDEDVEIVLICRPNGTTKLIYTIENQIQTRSRGPEDTVHEVPIDTPEPEYPSILMWTHVKQILKDKYCSTINKELITVSLKSLPQMREKYKRQGFTQIGGPIDDDEDKKKEDSTDNKKDEKKENSIDDEEDEEKENPIDDEGGAKKENPTDDEGGGKKKERRVKYNMIAVFDCKKISFSPPSYLKKRSVEEMQKIISTANKVPRASELPMEE